MSSGALAFFAFASIVLQSRWRNTRSRSMSSADAPSAAVRTITPPVGVSSALMMSFRRARSSSSSRRETPSPSPCGTKTTNRPGDPIVLEHGDALLAHVDGDEELALRGRERRAACGHPAPRGGTGRPLGFALRTLLGRALFRLLLGFRALGGLGLRLRLRLRRL